MSIGENKQQDGKNIKLRLYVVRHGESETNLAKRWTGWMDVSLTGKGREDAKKAGDFLKNIEFDRVLSSDLRRAVQTAETALPGCVPETSPLFREIDLGSLAGQPLADLTAEQRARNAVLGYVDFGGESKEQFRGRVRQAMEKLETLDCETAAVFTHGGWMRGLLDEVVGTYLPRKNIRCNNCAVAIFEVENGLWQLYSWINLT